MCSLRQVACLSRNSHTSPNKAPADLQVKRNGIGCALRELACAVINSPFLICSVETPSDHSPLDEMDSSGDADGDAPFPELLDFCSRAQTLIAELLLLSDRLPSQFRDPRFDSVLFDLRSPNQEPAALISRNFL